MAAPIHYYHILTDNINLEHCQQIINYHKLNTTANALNEAFKKIRDYIKEISIKDYNYHQTIVSFVNLLVGFSCASTDLYISLINAINQGYDMYKIIKLIEKVDGLNYCLKCPKNDEILQIFQDLQSYYGFNIMEVPFSLRKEHPQYERFGPGPCKHENCLITPLITQGKLTKSALK